MNNMKRTLFLLISLILVFAIVSCGGDSEIADSNQNPEVQQTTNRKGVLSGVAQKGQFLKGSSITIYALDNNLNATGLSYPTQIIDYMGSFRVEGVNAEYVDIKANGYYFNENIGQTSSSTINLQALATTDGIVNVNILTTLAYNRIKYLVGTGLTFQDAQTRAQIEVLTALGLGNSTSINFTDMNIANSGDANGLLLAASLLIQQSRGVGDVSKLISDIAADIEEDGLLSSSLNQEIHRNERNIYVGTIINGLIAFYEKNNIENYSIPTFYSFLDTDGDGKKDGEAGYIFKSIGLEETGIYNPLDLNPGMPANGFSITKTFLSTVAFNISIDVPWLSYDKTPIVENIYNVVITAQANEGENRTGHVVITDESGKELVKYTFQQKAVDNNVKQRMLLSGIEGIDSYIGINGKNYDIIPTTELRYNYDTKYYVDIPSTEKSDKYQLYYPTSMVSMPDGYGSIKVTIPQTVNSDVLPKVSQIESHNTTISNPTLAKLKIATPFVSVYIGNIYTENLILSSDYPICGSAKYEVTDGIVDKSNPQIISSETSTNSAGKYSFVVKMAEPDPSQRVANAGINIPVLVANVPISVKCYDKDGFLHEFILNSITNDYPTR